MWSVFGEYCVPSIWAPRFLMSIYCNQNYISSVDEMAFLTALKMFLSLVFRNLGFTQLLKSLGLYLVPNLENFQPFFKKILFQSHAFSSPSGTSMTLPLEILLHLTDSFLILFPYSYSYWIISIFKFIDSFPCSFHSDVEPIH